MASQGADETRVCTRDGYSFAVKQVGLRSSNKSLDEYTIRKATMTKVGDCRTTFRRQKLSKIDLETKIREDTSKPRFKTMKSKMMKKIRQ